MDNTTNTEESSTIEQEKKPSSRIPTFLQSKIFLTIGAFFILFLGGIFLFQSQKGTSIFEVAEEPKTIGLIQYIVFLDPVLDGFKEGMAELGYIEGKDIIYLEREFVSQPPDARDHAKKLIEKDPDLIMAITTVTAGAVITETAAAGRTDIPIVFSHAVNAVQAGLAESFKSSGNNSTGIEVNFPDLTAKKLEFLQRINPSIKKIGILDPVHTDIATTFVLPEFEKTAPEFGFEIIRYRIENAPGPEATEEIRRVMNGIQPGEIDAYFQIPSPVNDSPDNVPVVMKRMEQLKVPAVWLTQPQVTALGGLFTYESDLLAMGKQTAQMVDKVLKGVHPSDIPLEFAQKNVLIINLQAAEKINITIPSSLLEIADIIIE
ncbi:ABC transporter substrate-binding protein [Patescibacteria group bacterium]|nr:ABC transporter substrate-binding protein [Patescibacteria group bacterium]